MKIIFLLVSLFVASEAIASCDYNKKPKVSINEEFKRSDFVMVATITNQRVEEYSKNNAITYFNVEVNEILNSRYRKSEFKGEIFIAGNAKDKELELEDGKKYLLFVGYNPDGFLVAPCGNSIEFESSANVLKEVKLLSKR